MNPQTETNIIHPDFQTEFEAERAHWLRRRFLWYAAVSAVLGLIFITARVEIDNLPAWVKVFGVIATVVNVGVYAAAFVYVYRNPKAPVLRIAGTILTAGGIVSVLISAAMTLTLSKIATDTGTPERTVVPEATMVAFIGVGQILIAHVFACLFMPWTVRESIRPIVPVYIVHILLTAAFDITNIGAIAIAALLGVLAVVPGSLLCLWRNSRFRERFAARAFRGRYHKFAAELRTARKLHEALFPRPMREGPILFDYAYEPMRQLGGDFVFAARQPGGAMSIVLIDVTGHGVPAALTVTQLHGELQRLYTDDPNAGPDTVLTRLNRYSYTMLAPHSLYPTAVVLRIDPQRGYLEYASAGHPPAFLRRADGTIEELSPTTILLGVEPADDFDPALTGVRLEPNDLVIAYTDGALEARDRSGRMMGMKNLTTLVGRCSPGSGTCERVLKEVMGHQDGIPGDDILIVQLGINAVIPPRKAEATISLTHPQAAHDPVPEPAHDEALAGSR